MTEKKHTESSAKLLQTIDRLCAVTPQLFIVLSRHRKLIADERYMAPERRPNPEIRRNAIAQVVSETMTGLLQRGLVSEAQYQQVCRICHAERLKV